jgi:hypothetical protein
MGLREGCCHDVFLRPTWRLPFCRTQEDPLREKTSEFELPLGEEDYSQSRRPTSLLPSTPENQRKSRYDPSDLNLKGILHSEKRRPGRELMTTLYCRHHPWVRTSAPWRHHHAVQLLPHWAAGVHDHGFCAQVWDLGKTAVYFSSPSNEAIQNFSA